MKIIKTLLSEIQRKARISFPVTPSEKKQLEALAEYRRRNNLPHSKDISSLMRYLVNHAINDDGKTYIAKPNQNELDQIIKELDQDLTDG